ncbi:MAG: sigma-54 dependent transcriptional regulator [Syntrophobacteraceae bacterium]|nr:sigma-54 dependent transcriptional regulator [Syntrophobacteraceae bacterium]
MARVLIIEEDSQWQKVLLRGLGKAHESLVWPEGEAGVLSKVTREAFDIILLNLATDDRAQLIEKICKVSPSTPVIVTSHIDRAELVVRAIKCGAFDYLPKPYSDQKIRLAVDHALEHQSQKNELDYLRRQQDVLYDFGSIVAEAPAMKQVMSMLRKLADSDSTILITGETGTGKSFLSGTVHFNSRRCKKPFIKINCANISETLLESELFGHEKGAFTGAVKTRAGRFEQANGGTVFLDEIGEMSPNLQAKLLRVLDDKSFERVGGNQTLRVDIRIIAATNRILEDLIAAKRFREDLYYRIAVARVHLPPLRERRECLESIARHLLAKSCREMKRAVSGFSPEVKEAFNHYAWPGNIRQLANVIELAVLLEEGSLIQRGSVTLPEVAPKPLTPPPVIVPPAGAVPPQAGVSSPHHVPAPVPHSLDEHEKDLILRALEANFWSQKHAAEHLGITPRALNYKIRKFKIVHPHWRKNK